MQIINIEIGKQRAYIINAGKTAVIDGVCEKNAYEYIKMIRQYTDKPDYLICNHVSPDMQGSAKMFLDEFPDVKVVATVSGLRNMKAIVHRPFNEMLAKDGADLDDMRLRFIIAPNLNWPDTMMTLCGSDLFSGISLRDDGSYFEDMRCFKPFLTAALNKLPEIDRVFSAVGEYDGEIIEKCSEWAKKEDNLPKPVLVAYDSVTGCTYEMAKTVYERLKMHGVDAVLASADDGFDAENCCALAAGTPTINRGASQSLLTQIVKTNPLAVHGKPCFVFGSFGWSGEGTGVLHDLLKHLGFKPICKPFAANLKMSADDKAKLEKCVDSLAEECR